MGWPKGKKRGPKQPILDADNPPKKIRVINKKVIGNLKVLLMLVHPQFHLNQSKKPDAGTAQKSDQSLGNAERVIAAVASGKVNDKL